MRRTPAPNTRTGRVVTSLSWLLLMLAAAGCGQSTRSDVLEEFPPPRLARQAPQQEPSLRQLAVWAGTLNVRLLAPDDELSVDVPAGEGHFELSAQTTDLAGRLLVRLDEGHLPEELTLKLAGRARGTDFTWRVLEVVDADTPRIERQGTARVERTDLQALTEVEFNAVRTRHLQGLSITRQLRSAQLDASATMGDQHVMVWTRPLVLDLHAHHLHTLGVFPFPNALKRAELQLRLVLRPHSQEAGD